MQISHSVDTMAHSYKCHSIFFLLFFHFLIPLPTTSRRGTHVFSYLKKQNKTDKRTAVREVLFGGFVLAKVLHGLHK